MIHAIRKSLLALAVVASAACGSKDDPATTPPLPVEPQVFTSAAFAVFEVTVANDTSSLHLLFENGGQHDLVFTSFSVEQAGNEISITQPASLTAASRETVIVDLGFAPTARGVYLGTLLASSNAQNYPAIEMPIIGAASASPRPLMPDMIVYENPTPVLPEFNQAFVRLINVGRNTLTITHYEIMNDTDGAFELAGGVEPPTVEQPTRVGPGSFLGISVNYTSTAVGTHTADFQIVSNDDDEPTVTIGLTGTSP